MLQQNFVSEQDTFVYISLQLLYSSYVNEITKVYKKCVKKVILGNDQIYSSSRK